MGDRIPVWMARASCAPPKIFATPTDLWLACCEYFQWIEDNPLYAAETVKFKGVGTTMDVPRMRAMTQIGLCTFLGVTHITWRNYREHPEYADTCSAVDDIIYQQKLTGAAADLLNQNIIARELGLKDKQELAHTGAEGGPIATTVLDPAEYAKIRKQMLEDDDC